MSKPILVIYLTAISLAVVIPALAAPWKLPSAHNLQLSIEKCQPQHLLTNAKQSEILENHTSNSTIHAYLKCIVADLELWTDDEGYNSKRIAKLFVKQKMSEEIIVVVDYCNQRYRHEDLRKWAYDAFKCVTAGRVGAWVEEYVKGLYAAKGSK